MLWTPAHGKLYTTDLPRWSDISNPEITGKPLVTKGMVIERFLQLKTRR